MVISPTNGPAAHAVDVSLALRRVLDRSEHSTLEENDIRMLLEVAKWTGNQLKSMRYQIEALRRENERDLIDQGTPSSGSNITTEYVKENRPHHHN